MPEWVDELLCRLLAKAADPTSKEVDDFLNGPAPVLSEDEQVMLDDIGEDLPHLIKEWQARDEGCLVVKDERRNQRR